MTLKIRVLTFFVTMLIVATAAHSQQTKTGQSAEATLHILISDREPNGASRMPEGLAAISDQIKRRFNAGNLTLLDSYFGRLAVGGSGEFKSSIKFQRGTGTISEAFIDWRLVELGLSAEVFSAQNFRFGFRAVPTMRPTEDQTKPPGLINLESVGVSISELLVPENRPHLVGTTNMPDGVGKLFLVLTVRHAK
jgi:hypothetical protein